MPNFSEDDLKADFRNFLWLVWQHVLNGKLPTPVQYDIAYYLQHAPRRRIIEAFRGVGKSWITAAYVVWGLYCNPHKNYLVVSASKSLSDNFSTFCLQIINLIPELSHLRPGNNQREAKISFDVGPAGASKDPSVRSVGITGMITGSRADELIADDIESAGNSQTQMQRDKLSELVKEFDAVLKPNGVITYLGTPQCEQSLYNQLPTRGYSMRIWPARYPSKMDGYGDRLAPKILLELQGNAKLVGHSTDPQRFDDQDLQEREASYGRSGFALQFMLDTSLSDADRYPLKLADLIIMPLDRELGPAKVAWASDSDNCLNDVPNVGFNGDRFYKPMYVSRDQYLPWQGTIMAIDPSGRGKDETGYAVVKMLHGILYVTAWGGFRGGYDDKTLASLATIAKDNKVQYIVTESNFGDGMFSELLKPYLQRIYPCTVEDERSSGQKELRIIDTLEPVMNQHKLVIDKRLIEEDYKSTQGMGLEAAQKYQGFYQMTRITRDRHSLAKDDRLDALAIGVHYWVEQMSRDTETAVKDHKQQMLEEDLKKFVEEVSDQRLGTNNQTSWIHESQGWS